MILTPEQQISMLEAATPLIRWLNENCHLHCEAHVDHQHVELLEYLFRDGTDEFLKD